jgi:hypothetical protein
MRSAHGRAFSQSAKARVYALPFGWLVPAARMALARPTASPSPTYIQSVQCAPLRMRSSASSCPVPGRQVRLFQIESLSLLPMPEDDGAALMRHLATLGREAGLHEFTAEVLSENVPMLNVFERSGLKMTTEPDGTVMHVTLRLA